MALVERIGYVQLDPISVVERSPLLVLWSRLGAFARDLLDEALFEHRLLFEYWSHAASIVPTSDLPLHRVRMRSWPPVDAWGHRVRSFLEANDSLRREVLHRLAGEGPLPASAFGPATVRWASTGWTDGRDVDRLLDFLWIQGQVVVAGRAGGRRVWALADEWFASHPQGGVAELEPDEVVRRQVERSLRALGAATVRQVADHYNAGRYPGIERVVGEMVVKGQLVPVVVQRDGTGGEAGGTLKGEWYVHVDDLPLLEEIEGGGFEGRTVLLSPFDNLLIDRTRTEMLFDFEYRMEIYVPKVKRRFGYYVMPVLHEDRLVGRLDARAERKAGVLRILALHAEPQAARSAKSARVARSLRRAVEELASACGLGEFSLAGATTGPEVPVSWVSELK